MSDKRQKNQLQMVLAFAVEGRSEAPRARREGTESLTANCETESPAGTRQLLEEVCNRENLKRALRRVKANKGSPGIDGMKVGELPGYLKQHWPAIREQLLSGSCCLLRRARSSAIAGCRSSSTELNRRMRTRMYGGVAGEERRLSPLCRLCRADSSRVKVPLTTRWR